MITAVLIGALALAMPQSDTTFAVRSGGSLDIEAMMGSITLKTWDREEMRVRATHPGSVRVRIRNTGGMVDIEASSRNGHDNTPVQYEITVPKSFDISVDGLNFAVNIDGLQGDVNVENVEGGVTVRNVTGDVDVESVSGAIVLENVHGTVDVNTTNESIRISGVRGSVTAETVNGSVSLRRMDSAKVTATTVNGTADYDGTVQDGGRYHLLAYNGRVTMSIPEGTNATLSVSTENGKVDTAFPVQLRKDSEGRFRLTLGSGSARVELESYNGSIHLVRPAAR
jgi:DUF4097 and DUF4098 domain-containing protein YvlB